NMPATRELPETLGGLALINAVMVRNDPDFARDMERLLAALERAFASQPRSRRRPFGRGSASGPRLASPLSTPAHSTLSPYAPPQSETPPTRPLRPSRLSRRHVLAGSGIAAGLLIIGDIGWMIYQGQGTGSAHTPAVVLPAHLASLRYTLHTQESTKYILPPLRDVATGDFLMGSDPARDPQAVDNEKPLSRVALNAFQIATHLVTVAEYAAFVQQSGHT